MTVRHPIFHFPVVAALLAGLCCLPFRAPASGIAQVTANGDKLIFRGEADGDHAVIAELSPFQTEKDAPAAPVAIRVESPASFEISCPRFDGERDRIYSGFLLMWEEGGGRAALGTIRHVGEMRAVARYTEPFPQAASKKGLQVQMVDDALALGVKHAALNVNLAQMVDLAGAADSLVQRVDGVDCHIGRGVIEQLDRQIKPLSDAGVLVSLILLVYESGNPAVDAAMLHPRYDHAAPNHLGAFNTATPEGVRWFRACVEFLAGRYSRPDHRHGRAVNFIVGNEVNSHWEWANMGRVPMEEFARDYLRVVRIAHTAVRKSSSSARVYLSLEHHWNIRYDKDPMKSFSGRPFVDFFARAARDGGDFDWNLAFHPYPENLFDCRFWNDKTARHDLETPRVTFKNLEVLAGYFRRSELLYHGEPRRIILSEQGFHSPATPEGEVLQAAAYCLAWRNVGLLDGIDSLILHRHVDHGHEGGLNLGLWARDTTSPNPAQPLRKKPIYEVFRSADTPGWESAFRFALPIVGLQEWPTIPAPESK